MEDVDIGRAVAWAQTHLHRSVVRSEPLAGGMTSTMLALDDDAGGQWVLRLMTVEPWRSSGPGLTRREASAQAALLGTAVPAPRSVALDCEGEACGVSAHLMSRLPGEPTDGIDEGSVGAMAEMLAVVHDVRPDVPLRTFQSWAWEAKWVVPPWTAHPDAWQRAFDLLAADHPAYEPTFLHRDFSHRNLLWQGGGVSGVVDWVETSTGPRWLDAGHAATNLAVAFGPEWGRAFLEAYSEVSGSERETHWLVMDAVGFLPPPGKRPMFGSAEEVARLDAWLVGLL